MYEHLASFFGPPNLYHFDLYSEWAKHQWGMILTGNVEVSADHLTLGRDMITPKHITDENLVLFKKVSAVHIHLENINWSSRLDVVLDPYERDEVGKGLVWLLPHTSIFVPLDHHRDTQRIYPFYSLIYFVNQQPTV